MKLTAKQLPSALNKTLLPCYLVTGDEHLLAQEALDAIRAAARRHGFGAREVHVAGSGFDWQELAAAAGSLSLFAEKRLLELKLPTGKPGREGSAAIVELADKLGEDLMLLVSAPRLDRHALSAKWVEALEKRGAVIQVWPVDLRELPGWIEGRMRGAGLVPDGQAVAMIAGRVEGNLLAAHQEIEKLKLLLGDGPVSSADVEQAVADSSRYDVFKLNDAAVAGDTARALRILGGLREEGVEPPLVAWALVRELRALAKLAHGVAQGVDLGTAMRKERVWPSRQNLVRACLRRHGPADLHRLLKIARTLDAAIRGQVDVDPWQLATELVFGLSEGRAKAA